MYRFYYDSDEIADNLIRKWKEETHEAFEVAVGLVQKIEELYEKAIVEDSEVEGHTIDVDAALKSTEYKSYINAACELAQVSIEELNDTERMAFFLNVYQCMYIHYFLRMVNEGKVVSSSNSYMSKLKNYAFDYSSKPFYYNIGGHNYDLDDIKQGMFRGNQRKPGSLLRQLSANDEKCKFLPTVSKVFFADVTSNPKTLSFLVNVHGPPHQLRLFGLPNFRGACGRVPRQGRRGVLPVFGDLRRRDNQRQGQH